MFLYDDTELRSVLSEALFMRFRRVEHRQSDHSELRGLEQRESQLDLIVKAQP